MAMPALLTSASSRPKRSATLSSAAATPAGSDTSQVMAMVVSGLPSAAKVRCEVLAVDIEQRHPPAVGEEALGGGEPDAARGAGHQGGFFQLCGHRSPRLRSLQPAFAGFLIFGQCVKDAAARHKTQLEPNPFRLNHGAPLTFYRRMIFSENRFPLFGIIR